MKYGVNRGFGLRSALLLGAASVTGLGTCSAALAQQQAAVETVVVTGSRIPQQGLYSSSPVTAVGQQEMKFEGTTDVTTLVNNLPQAFIDQNSGMSNASTGTANVDLRGLGSKRTLVLVNGTRLMPGDIAAPVADLNDIPAAMVDHVEVLTGGASAVYGSDALSGVVNFIMRKDFEGIELDGTYSVAQSDNDVQRWRAQTQDEIDGGAYGFQQSKENTWDGATVDSTLVMGSNTANDKGNITVYLGYRNSQPVLEANRDFSECTLASTGNTAACSGSSNFNRWLSFDNLFHDIATSFAHPTGYDFFEEPHSGTPGGGHFVPYTGAAAQHFNYGALNYLQRPDQRYTGGFFGHYDVNKELDVYSNFMFADDDTVAQIAQSGLFLGSGQGFSGTVYVNCGNPLMTAQENVALCGSLPGDMLTTVGTHTFWNGAGNTAIPGLNPGAKPGQAQLLVGRRDIEGGDRQNELRHTSYRMNIGAKGDLGNGWSYDVYAQYGLSLFSENYQNEFSKTRVQNALEVDPATGQCIGAEATPPNAPGCVPLDIFNGLGSITPAMLGYVRADGLQEGYTQEQIMSGSLTGDLGEWGIQSPWAKSPVAVSIGAEYRQETLRLITDQEFTTNDLYGQGSATLSVPTSGFNVTEGFTEVRVPLVQDMPFVEDLSFNAGFRYSSYNIAGATTTYKYGAEWQPIDDIRVRASINRAVRAPNVIELFAPANVVLFSGQDPCAFSTAGACSTVKNAGNPAVLACPATQCYQQLQGNQHLKPEVSDTRTAGVVLTPTFLDGFTATIDWFDIKVDKFISTISPPVTLNGCYGPTANAASEAYYCPFVVRNSAGQIWAAGGYVGAQTLNTGYLKTSGIDFEANYNANLDDWWLQGDGSLSFNFIGTWLDTLTTEPVPINPLTSAAGIVNSEYGCAGYYGLTCGAPDPRWRHKLRVTWNTPWDVDVSLAWRYIDAVQLDADSENANLGGSSVAVHCANGRTVHGGPFNPVSPLGGDCFDAQIGSINYFDLAGTWTVREGVQLNAGVNNILGTEPPVVATSALTTGLGNGNTFPGVYDALGRLIFVSATIKY